jgi:hypothetical protein
MVMAIYLVRGRRTRLLKTAVTGNKMRVRASNPVEETFYSRFIVIEVRQGKTIHMFHTFRRGGTTQ